MSSIIIVGVISLFMGGVLVIQTASNMENPFLDRMLIGYMVRESMILEFSSTMVALILAGKMGSSIASEIGSMRITQQLDAIDMMGINSASFVARPKILAATLLSPVLTLFGEFRKLLIVIPYLSRVGFEQAYQHIEQHGLAGTAGTDEHVALPFPE